MRINLHLLNTISRYTLELLCKELLKELTSTVKNSDKTPNQILNICYKRIPFKERTLNEKR